MTLPTYFWLIGDNFILTEIRRDTHKLHITRAVRKVLLQRSATFNVQERTNIFLFNLLKAFILKTGKHRPQFWKHLYAFSEEFKIRYFNPLNKFSDKFKIV